MDIFKIEGSRIIWENEGEILWLEPYGDNCLRFRSTKSGRMVENDWTLLPQKECTVHIEVTDSKATITNGKIKAEVLVDGTVNYYNNEGKALLRESWIDRREHTAPMRPARHYKAISSETFEVSLYFKADKEEHFYGMGQYANDCLDLKGCTIELAQKNTQCTIPFLLSTRGYGFVWNNPAIGRAELVKNHTMWYAAATKQIDYLIFAGDSPDEIVRKYTDLSGKAPMLPEFAAGFWQCKLRYWNQEELLSVAREYKRRGLPISVIVIDFFHWTQQGDWKFDPKYWPDPKVMVDELNKLGIKLMVSIWPTVDPRSENYEEMRRKSYLIRAERGVQAFFMYMGAETYYDATHPDAQKYVWSKAKQNYYDYGIKMFWLDEAEPELRPYDYENVRYHLGNGLEVSNIYPYMYAKTFYDGMTACGETEIVNLLRCAWIGSQRYGTVVWSGDIASTFDSLRRQVKAGLNISLCGIPWWTTDIGGFFDGYLEDPYFRELIVRWFQFGVFCPIFRLHGYRQPEHNPNGLFKTGADNEVWSFGEEAYEIITKLMFMRERLKSYIMEQMKKAHEDGTPVMRPIFYDFPNDKVAYAIEDEFMFGPDILVAPVLYEGARSRKVYLPEGAEWTDANNGNIFKGGQYINYETPLSIVPVFLKNGINLPIKQ
ncbi:MAG: alpha-D-xyloside xylohydrolase [Epulopiscium sp.]|jgi:alpha-D-xyloside xylohydrolase|nr:alpha-D-xyloside xylohydrolase [Candidatus Epulonipiscium sp.]